MITRKKKRNINNITKSLKQKNDKHIELQDYQGVGGAKPGSRTDIADSMRNAHNYTTKGLMDTTLGAMGYTLPTPGKRVAFAKKAAYNAVKAGVSAVGVAGTSVGSILVRPASAGFTEALQTIPELTDRDLTKELRKSIALILIKQPKIVENENQELLDTIITYEDKKQPIREILIKNISSIFAKGQTRVNLTNTSTHNERFKDYLSETASIKASGTIAKTVGVVSTAISDASNAIINYTAATESVVDDVRLVFPAIYKYVNTLYGQVEAVIKVFEACAGDFVKTNVDISNVFHNLTEVRTDVNLLCSTAKEVTRDLVDLKKVHQKKIIELSKIYNTIKVKASAARTAAALAASLATIGAAAAAGAAARAAVDLIVPSISNLITDIDYLSDPVEVIIKYVDCAVATTNIYNLATTYTEDVENAKKTAIALSDAYTKVSNINLSVLTDNDIKKVNDALIDALALPDSDETERKEKLAVLSARLTSSKATTTAQNLANDIVKTIIYIKTAETSAALVVEHAENVVKQYNNPDPPAAAAGAVAAAPAAAAGAVAAALPPPPILAAAVAAVDAAVADVAATLATTTATSQDATAAAAAAATATSADKAIAAAAKAHKASAKLAIDIVKAVGSVMPEKTKTAITKANASAITAEESAKKARYNVDIVITDLKERLEKITSLITKRAAGLSSQIGGGKIFSNYGARNFDQEDAIEFIKFILECLKELDTIDTIKPKIQIQNLLRSKYLSVLFSKIGPSQLNLLLPQIELVQEAFEEVIAHFNIWFTRINDDVTTGTAADTATATVTAPAPTDTPAKNISKLNFLLISNAGSLMSTIIDIIMTPEQLQGNENKIANNLDRKFEMAFKMPSDEEKRRVENYELLKALKYILNDQETKPISVMKQFKERISQIDTLIDSMNEGNILEILQQVALKLPLTRYTQGGYLYSIPDSFKKKISESEKNDDDSGEAIQELIKAIESAEAAATAAPGTPAGSGSPVKGIPIAINIGPDKASGLLKKLKATIRERH